MENNQGGKSKNIYLVLIILLLIGNIAALYFLFCEKQARKDVETQRATLQQNVQSLNDTLDAKKMQLEQLKGTNAEMDSTIAVEEKELDKQKREISNLVVKGKMTNTELAKAKDMISQDETSIAALQKKVDELNKQNQDLTNQNQQLNTDLTNEKKTTGQLTQQNQGLSKKVDLASLLQPTKVTLQGVSKKKDKDVVEKRIKKVESLKVSFETGDNKVLDPGTVSLYVRIINPKGETIAVADQGSGTLQNSAGETVQYTKKADIDWNQANKTVDVYWTLNIKDAGVYKTEIYQNGFIIGKGQVELK